MAGGSEERPTDLFELALASEGAVYHSYGGRDRLLELLASVGLQVACGIITKRYWVGQESDIEALRAIISLREYLSQL